MSKEIEKYGGMSPEEVLAIFGQSTPDSLNKRSFGQVKIMKETAQFQCPNGNLIQSVRGHVIFLHERNSWYATSFTEREGLSGAPNCASYDGIKPSSGDMIQSEFCGDCPLNQFGSGKDGKGKACRNSIRMIMLLDGDVIPVIVSAPPTSLASNGSLISWINNAPNDVAKAYKDLGIKTSTGGPIVDTYLCKVEFSLTREKFGTKEASVIQAKSIGVLTPADRDHVETIRYLHSIRKDAIESYKAEITRYDDAPF